MYVQLMTKKWPTRVKRLTEETDTCHGLVRSGRGATLDSTNTEDDHGMETAYGSDMGTTVPSHDVDQIRRSERTRRVPIWHQDYDVQLNTVKINSPPVSIPTLTAKSGYPYSLSHYLKYDQFSILHRAFLAAITMTKEPNTFGEAVCDPRWREAMSREIQALECTDTWEIRDLPPGKKAIFCKWVYKIKYTSDGMVERYKARLVVCGNRQVEGIDYGETFTPVAKMVTVRTVMTVAASCHWELHQMDIDNSFLHGDLHEEVYMHLPPGYSSSSPGKVCRLLQSLYGLRQAPRCWFSKLTSYLRDYGFMQTYVDYTLFTKRKDSHIICVLIYVDDLLITGNDRTMITEFKTYLASTFPIKDLGIMKYFLGIEMARNPTRIFLCQRKYVLDILTETGLSGCKPVTFSMVQNHRLQSNSSPFFLILSATGGLLENLSI